ncbi:hypothetical protein KC19_8G003000 [Ceratodon purpureus]|uniref:Uncharacterized protein n=1 Tax=Ceratodon purpureus TaxID=3225 RepID=A0A8T0H1U0_CERPU|nr:hypothetical protein KC19_8G003000 [Ceratodon purpureus]
MVKFKYTPRHRRPLGVAGPSSVSGPLRPTSQAPWFAVMGPGARWPRPPGLIEISDSSDSDSSRDRAPLVFRRSRQRDVIVLSDSDSDSDGMPLSPQRTPPRLADVTLAGVDDVSVGPASDAAFGSPFDVGPIVSVSVDEDGRGDSLVQLDPVVDDTDSDGSIEVEPVVEPAVEEPPRCTLRHIFPLAPEVFADPPALLERFPPLRGPYMDIDEEYPFNDPDCLDIDAACFMMLTMDLPSLFGIMARPANRKIRIRDSLEFRDWLHVISDPVVVRVYAGSTEHEVRRFRDQVVENLRTGFGLTLTPNPDFRLLSRNQVNVSISALSIVLHHLGARICRVSFFGMKWNLPSAEPIIDRYIGRYRDQMGASVPEGKNFFDYGFSIPSDQIELFGFSEAQLQSHQFREGRVHEMCDMEGFGSLSLNPSIDERISRVKIYQELCHEILSVLPRMMLDDMPSTMRTMRTRARQLRDLITGWQSLSDVERVSRLGGVRVELSVHSESVRDGRFLCSSLDLFRCQGIEDALQGGFLGHAISIEEFLASCDLEVSRLAAAIHGRDERDPGIRIQSGLTFARQSIGWSGKFMEQQLRAARAWRNVERRQVVARQESEFKYDGWEMDAEPDRARIQDFLDHAEWFLHSTTKDRTIPGLMLMRANGRGYLPKAGLYTDRVGAARWYLRELGPDWRLHIRSVP